MDLSELLRDLVLHGESVSAVAKATQIPQATLQEFAVGRADGRKADLRLSNAQRLIDHFGIRIVASTVKRESTGGRRMRMKLKDELLNLGLQDSPEKFRERLIDELMERFKGETIDSLVCQPPQAERFCERIREEYGCAKLSDYVVLKTLMNIRRRKDCPRGLCPSPSRRRLDTKLAAEGVNVKGDEFNDVVANCFAELFRNMTVDDVLCDPKCSIQLCKAVRSKLACDYLSDSLILSTLLNSRKSP